MYGDIVEFGSSVTSLEKVSGGDFHSDITAKCAIEKAYYSKKIKLIEKIAKETDPDLWQYILLAVTEGYSYTYSQTKLNMPCSRDMYYDRYRKFFWLLSKARD